MIPYLELLIEWWASNTHYLDSYRRRFNPLNRKDFDLTLDHIQCIVWLANRYTVASVWELSENIYLTKLLNDHGELGKIYSFDITYKNAKRLLDRSDKKSLSHALQIATHLNNFKLVKLLVRHGASPQYYNQNAIVNAAYNNNLKMVKYLASKGGCVNTAYQNIIIYKLFNKRYSGCNYNNLLE